MNVTGFESVEVNSTLVSRNITVQDKRTSIRLEPEMWAALYDVAEKEDCSIHDICTLISFRKKEKTSLTAAIRVFIMLYYRAAATEDGHRRAGHGDFETMKMRARICEEKSMFFRAQKKRKFSGRKCFDTPYRKNIPFREMRDMDQALSLKLKA